MPARKKTCTGCGESKPLSAYNRKGKGHQATCRECNKAYLKQHYANNRDYYRGKAAKYRGLFRTKIAEYKAAKGCDRCEEDHPSCLEFHHANGRKEGNVSRMIDRGSQATVWAEIKKCVVLCSNCHRKLHWDAHRAEAL